MKSTKTAFLIIFKKIISNYIRFNYINNHMMLKIEPLNTTPLD